MRSSHQFEEHTSEVKVRVFAPTLPSLFEEACRALAEVMTGTAPPRASEPAQPIEVHADDREALLAAWLNELIYRTEMDGVLYSAPQVEHVSDTALVAKVGAAAVPALKTPVKAATMHELSVAPLEREGGWTASVVLDV